MYILYIIVLKIKLITKGAAAWTSIFIDINKEGAAACTSIFIDINKEGAAAWTSIFIDINKEGAAAWTSIFIVINKDGVGDIQNMAYIHNYSFVYSFFTYNGYFIIIIQFIAYIYVEWSVESSVTICRCTLQTTIYRR